MYLSQVAEFCGRNPLALAIAGSLPSVTDSPNSALAWSQVCSEIEKNNTRVPGLQMAADIRDDLTPRSLFSVLNLSVESLNSDEQRRFLGLVVLPRGVSAPIPMLASIWQTVRVLLYF